MPDLTMSTAEDPSVTFHSILFRHANDRASGERAPALEHLADLNLDQIVAAITTGREEYDLKPFFHAPLFDLDSITFRHEVMQDLERADLFERIKAFAQAMRKLREYLSRSEKVHHNLQKQRWFLEAAHTYCTAVTGLAEALAAAHVASCGFRSFEAYVERYRASRPFTSLLRQTEELSADVASIVYGIRIQGSRVDVRHYEGEPDYSAEVAATFDRFSQGAAEKYNFDFAGSPDVNHVEAQILDHVARLFGEIFARLEAYCTANEDFRDPTIVAFDREVQFYLAYLDYMARFRKAGLSFCYPVLTAARDEIFDYGGFDLALAGSLLSQNSVPVCNDFHLKNPERIIIVSGPNQGGKTTFARTFGQLHYLASLGCPVPGARARLYLFDKLLTHFERAESIVNLRGKLQDDLIRIHRILNAGTPRSIIVMNEIFASTTLRDALTLSRKIATALKQLNLYCVWVTFIDELASLGETTVSMTSTIVPDNPALRTYKIVRRPADGLAYAISIAEKHRVTYRMIRERIGR